MKLEPATIGSGRPLESYRDDSRNLSAEEFQTRHGDAFLLLSSIPTPQPQNTSSTHLAFLDEPEANTGALSIVVYPLRSSVHIVSVGNGFSISGEGVALNPGIEGQAAKVRIEGGRVVTGRAVATRRVEVML